MMATVGRSMLMGNWRCSKYRYVLVLFIALGSAVCIMSSDACAGGVHFGFGVDVPLPSPAVYPPVMVYPPPVVVERTPPPPRVVYEQAPPPVVVRRTPPVVVYEEPVVVERRSTVYYYPQAYQYRPYQETTEREYYQRSSRSWEYNDQY